MSTASCKLISESHIPSCNVCIHFCTPSAHTIFFLCELFNGMQTENEEKEDRFLQNISVALMNWILIFSVRIKWTFCYGFVSRCRINGIEFVGKIHNFLLNNMLFEWETKENKPRNFSENKFAFLYILHSFALNASNWLKEL